MFAYCENNPILFVDGSGSKIEIKPTHGGIQGLIERIIIYCNLCILTNDILSFNDDGTLRYIETENTNYPSGTQLIRDLINSDNLVQISIRDFISAKNATKSSETKWKIEYTDFDGSRYHWVQTSTVLIELNQFDVNHDPDLYTPFYIITGHELVHAWRMVYGDPFHGDIEEAIVIGLSSATVRIPVTENDLRAEHGLMPRIKYD